MFHILNFIDHTNSALYKAKALVKDKLEMAKFVEGKMVGKNQVILLRAGAIVAETFPSGSTFDLRFLSRQIFALYCNHSLSFEAGKTQECEDHLYKNAFRTLNRKAFDLVAQNL